LIVIGDATGHGIAPALSVTQRHAMLRMALRMGADPQTAVMLVNDQLAAKLDDDRFITAFIGLLGGTTHRMRLRSAGRAPILHFQAAAGACVRGNRTSSPLAAMAVSALRPAARLEFMPGDILDLLSDAIYEYHDAGREQFWPERVEAILRTHHFRRMAELSATLLDAVRAVARRAAQDDDITLVLVKREAPA
jgi:serine phosphatase RsbU (regulator of sigma subunit)